MNVPKPPFHSVSEELLYNIFLKLSGNMNSNGLTPQDLSTLAKVNELITDADLMSAQQIEAALNVIRTNLTNLETLFQLIPQILENQHYLKAADIDSLTKLNDIIADEDLLSLTQTFNEINALKGNVPAAGDTLEKLYNIIQGLNYLTRSDIDTLAELNAILSDADLVRTTDLNSLLDNVAPQGNTLKKLYDLINAIAPPASSDSPPSFYCDFDIATTDLPMTPYNLGGGPGANPSFSGFGVDTIENCFGVLKLSTGTSTAGGAAVSSTFANIPIGTGYKIIFTARVALDTLSDDVNTFAIYLGMGGNSVLNANPTNGIFFRYKHSVNNGKWEAVCRQATNETSVSTNFVTDANTYRVFEIRINETGDSVNFYIDDLVNPVATIHTNIPSGPLQAIALFGKIEKTLGAVPRNFYLDYIKYVPSRSTPRPRVLPF